MKKKQSVNTKEEVMDILKKHRKELLKFSVKKIGLFGSFGNDRQHAFSDIDIIVEFNKITFDNYMDLKFGLEELFGRKVDLVIKGNLKPALKYIREEVKYAKV